jgi:hypothetical protein
MAQPWLRFHTPLIQPDVKISCIRLSDKTSRLRPRHVVPKPVQAYEPEVPVEVREWVAPAPPDFAPRAPGVWRLLQTGSPPTSCR